MANKDYIYKIVAELAKTDLPSPATNYKFHPTRRWQIDVAWPTVKLGIELHGGSFGGGVVECNHCGEKVYKVTKQGRKFYVRETFKHNTGKGLRNDLEKANAAQFMGWMLLGYETSQINAGIVDQIVEVYKKREALFSQQQSAFGGMQIQAEATHAKPRVSRARANGSQGRSKRKGRSRNGWEGWEEVFGT